MEEKQQQLLLGIGAVVVGIIVLLWLLMGGDAESGGRSRGGSAALRGEDGAENRLQGGGSGRNAGSRGGQHSGQTSYATSSGGRSSPSGRSYGRPFSGSTERPFSSKKSEQEFKAMMAEIEENRKKVHAQAHQWTVDRVNDMSLATETREVYRLKLLKGFVKGHEALDQNRCRDAIDEFEKALTDEHASDVSRYLTYRYLIEAARRMGDMEQYLKYSKIQADLVAEKDLTVLSIKKSIGAKQQIEEFAEYLRASKSPDAMQSLLAKKMAGCKLTGKEREKRLESVLKMIQRRASRAKEKFYALRN